jgi:RNA polymerase sigma factor (sigma-70 family)
MGPVTDSLGSNDDGQAAKRAHDVILQHEKFIQVIIHLYARNTFQEEDLYQQLFLCLALRPVPPDVENVKGYLYRMIRHDVIDSIAREKADLRRMKKHAEKMGFPIHNPPPHDALILAEETDRVFQCAKERLCQREATAFTLRYRDDCSIDEIAQRMGVQKRTVSRYITASVAALRRFLP